VNNYLVKKDPEFIKTFNQIRLGPETKGTMGKYIFNKHIQYLIDTDQ